MRRIWEGINTSKISAKKLTEETIRKYKHDRCKDNIKMDFTGIGCDCVD
jgi:hypothetical protein